MRLLQDSPRGMHDSGCRSKSVSSETTWLVFRLSRADDNVSLQLKSMSDKSIPTLQGLPIKKISVIDEEIAVTREDRMPTPTADVMQPVKRREHLFSNFMS